jgi:hypothetical protein
MTYSVDPLHPSQISNGDPVYHLNLHPETQRILERRAEQTHPTLATTQGRPEWRFGKSVDRPTTSGAPKIFSPSDLERKPVAEERSNLGSMDELLRRLAKSSPAVRHRASLTARARISPHPHVASGARHNAVDRASIQAAHDALSELGAVCTTGSQNDGNRNP